MQRALTFSGYEIMAVWGEGQHNGKQGTAVFPAAMRWLWKNWPSPVKAGMSRNPYLAAILIPGEDWELVGKDYSFTEGTATDARGRVFYQDIPNSKTYMVEENGRLSSLNLNAKKSSGTSFGPDGKRYVVAGATNQLLSYDTSGKESVLADSIAGNDLVVANNGNIYITAPDGVQKASKIFLIRPNGEKLVVDEGLKFANGITLSPDQTQIYVTESATHWVWAYQVAPDGRLTGKQRYGWLHVPDTQDNAWSDGLRCDTAGRIYVTTRLGIQVLDQLGRVNAIIPIPAGQPSNLCFGGSGFDTIYVTAVDKVYRRKLRVRGANNFAKPSRPIPTNL